MTNAPAALVLHLLVASGTNTRPTAAPPDAWIWIAGAAGTFAVAFVVVVLALRKAARMVDPRLESFCAATGLKLHGMSARGRYRDRHLTIETAIAGPRRVSPTNLDRRRASTTGAVSAGFNESIGHLKQLWPRLFRDHRQIRFRTEIQINVELVPLRAGVAIPPRDTWKPVAESVRQFFAGTEVTRQDFTCRLDDSSLEISLVGDKFEEGEFLQKLLDAAIDTAEGVFSEPAEASAES